MLWSLWFFVVLLLVLNSMALNRGGEEVGSSWAPSGLFKVGPMCLAGVVLAAGMLLAVLGLYAHFDLTDGCPENQDCLNWGVLGVILLGAFFVVVAMFSLGGFVLGGGLGKMLVRLANLGAAWLQPRGGVIATAIAVAPRDNFESGAASGRLVLYIRTRYIRQCLEAGF